MENHFSGAYALKTNTDYTTENGAQYTTNANGQISTFSGDLSQDKAARSPSHQQRLSGKEMGEDASHLIASSQGGSGKIDNLVRMDAHVNRTDYRAFERENDGLMQDGKEVHLDGSLVNNVDGRPDAIMVSRTVTDPATGETRVDHNSWTNVDMRGFDHDDSWVSLADEYPNPGAVTVDETGRVIGEQQTAPEISEILPVESENGDQSAGSTVSVGGDSTQLEDDNDIDFD